MAVYEAKITPYYFVYTWWETDFPSQYIVYCDTKDELFRRVSKFYAFSDCEYEDYSVEEISVEGIKCVYCGWQPGMKYEYKSVIGIEWVGYFPEWDH